MALASSFSLMSCVLDVKILRDLLGIAVPLQQAAGFLCADHAQALAPRSMN